MPENKTYTGRVVVSGRGVGYFAIEGREEDIEIQPVNAGLGKHIQITPVDARFA